MRIAITLLVACSCGIFGIFGCDNRSQQQSTSKGGAEAVSAAISFGGPKKLGEHAWRLSGSISGQLADDESLWLVAEQDGRFRPVRPQIELDRVTKAWQHESIQLPAGKWKLHVCVASNAGKKGLDRGAKANFEELPDGLRLLTSIDFEVPDVFSVEGLYTPHIDDASNDSEKGRAGSPDASTLDAPAPAEQLEPLPTKDRVVIQFNAPIEDIRERVQFGIFREEVDKDSRRWQWIEEFDAVVPLADGSKTRSLRLNYDVSVRGTYNGWWLDLEEADWSAYAKGKIVLRLRPGTPGPSVFKFELKNDPDNERKVLPFIVRLGPEHLAAVEKQGFCDVSIPMAEISEGEDISRMAQLVIVFENRRVDEKKGDLLIQSIRLSPNQANEE